MAPTTPFLTAFAEEFEKIAAGGTGLRQMAGGLSEAVTKPFVSAIDDYASWAGKGREVQDLLGRVRARAAQPRGRPAPMAAGPAAAAPAGAAPRMGGGMTGMQPMPLPPKRAPQAEGVINAEQYGQLRQNLQADIRPAQAQVILEPTQTMPPAQAVPGRVFSPTELHQINGGGHTVVPGSGAQGPVTPPGSFQPPMVVQAPSRWDRMRTRFQGIQNQGRQWWGTLSPEAKNRYMMAGVGAGSLGLGFGLGEAGDGR